MYGLWKPPHTSLFGTRRVKGVEERERRREGEKQGGTKGRDHDRRMEVSIIVPSKLSLPCSLKTSFTTGIK